MECAVLRALRRRRPEIKRRWASLLRLEPATTPLANPEILIRLFDFTLDRLFCALTDDRSTRRESRRSKISVSKRCWAQNPFPGYFRTGEAALCETLVNLEGMEGFESAGREMRRALRRIGEREIETFCSLCQGRCGVSCSAPASRHWHHADGFNDDGGFKTRFAELIPFETTLPRHE